jgi:hypothetical protein
VIEVLQGSACTVLVLFLVETRVRNCALPNKTELVYNPV